jgi:uncharacterized protein (UPF0335 family)
MRLQELERLKQFKTKYKELKTQTSAKLNGILKKLENLENENFDLKQELKETVNELLVKET